LRSTSPEGKPLNVHNGKILVPHILQGRIVVYPEEVVLVLLWNLMDGTAESIILSQCIPNLPNGTQLEKRKRASMDNKKQIQFDRALMA
jgi:hypothetical protein